MGPKKKENNGNSYEHSVNVWVEKYWKKNTSGNKDRERGGDIVLDCVVKKSFRKLGAFELWSKWQKGASHVKSFKWHEQQAPYPQTGVSWDIWRTERRPVGLIEWKCDTRWSQRGKLFICDSKWEALVLLTLTLAKSEPGSCMFCSSFNNIIGCCLANES